MQCPECGYVLDAFDETCPKCARLNQTVRVSIPAVDPAAQAPASTLGYPPPTPPAPNKRPVAIGIGIALALVALLCLSLVPHSPDARRGGSSDLMVLDLANVRPASGLVQGGIDPQQIQQRLASASAVTGGELEVSLAWDSLSDFDLEVRDPSGETISADHRQSASGGVQDIDANPTLVNEEGVRRIEAGQSPGPENIMPLPDFLVDLDKNADFSRLESMLTPEGKAPGHFTRTPIEHIYFAHAPQGVYTIFARCYSWREPTSTPQPVTVQVKSRGQIFFQTPGTLGPKNFVTDGIQPIQVCQFQVR